jgi:signal transduction histidine kinase
MISSRSIVAGQNLKARAQSLVSRLTWAHRFMLASLMILVAGMLGIGWWVCQAIQAGVVQQTATNVALFVTGWVQPNLQELANGAAITPEHQASLAHLMDDTSLGQHITAVKVWDTHGRVVYATDAASIGKVFPVDGNLMHALHGWVAADINTLDQPENQFDRDRGQRRLETYSPVRLTGTSQVIGVVEFYQTVDGLDKNLAVVQRNTWLVVGLATGAMLLLLAGFVRRASDTIQHQQAVLSNQVARLKELLAQNDELHERVRRAARRTTALNERFLRRISAELHDGPAQDLGLALLRLDHLEPQTEPSLSRPAASAWPDFRLVQSSLRHALEEIRAISAGMGMPELENLTPAQAVSRAVRAHERRTNSQVTLKLDGLPGQLTLPVKITLYRLIQEALSNAYRHGGGAGQEVRIDCQAGQLRLVVSDRGPGFEAAFQGERDEHLGLVGMRERVESLGGTFRIESKRGQGTRVIAQLPLEVAQGEYER